MRQSGNQHAKLKTDLQNDFATGNNYYPKARQQTLHLLDKYSKSAVVNKPSNSEGASFVQGGGGDNRKKKEAFDKAYWKDKVSYKCDAKGHPASHCTSDRKSGKKASKDDDDDDVASTASSVNKLKKQVKKVSKSFTI